MNTGRDIVLKQGLSAFVTVRKVKRGKKFDNHSEGYFSKEVNTGI
jgi:hypothetical protein